MSVSKQLFNKIRPLLLLCLALSCLFSGEVVAQSGVFQVALRAAKDGDFSRAVILFEALYKHGNHNPNLIYNLASCHYRLGDMAEAHNYFSLLLEDEKFQALAAYNMGLIEAKLGDDVAAIHSFQRSLAATKPNNKALVMMNSKALSIISTRNSGYQGSLDKSWFATISMAVSHDDNAQLLDNELLQNSAITDADTQLSTILAAQTTLGGDRKNGYNLGAFYNSLRYKTIDANSALYSVYMNRVSSIWDDSKSELGIEVSRQSYLDYLDTYYAAKYRLVTRFSENNRIDLTYRYQWVEPQDITQYWRGSSQDIKARFSLGELGNSAILTMTYETNNRLDKIDLTPISFSPLRIGYSLGYEYKRRKHALAFSFQYRLSHYRGETYDTVNISGTPTTIILQRQDRKKAFNLSYRYEINRKWQFSLNFYRQSNYSNRSLSNYQQSVAGSEIMYSF